MKLILFFILPALIYGIEEDGSKEEQFAIDDTKKDSDPEFETKAHHTTGSFYYVLNKSQPQTRRNDFVPAAPNTRPVWRPCKSKIKFCLNTLGQKSAINPNIHILKISLFTKFTI